MSTDANIVTQPQPARPAASQPSFLARLAGSRRIGDQIRVYHHSSLFYWWPVWLLGYFCAVYTYVENHHLAVVPAGTVARNQPVELKDGSVSQRSILVLPEELKQDDLEQPTVYISRHRTLGLVYVLTLLLVIIITNISIRGLWSILTLVFLVSMVIIMSINGWLEILFRQLGQLGIYINLGTYIFLSTALLILWSINFFLFDRQTYMLFTPGQLRVRLEIGGGETVYDTTGMTVQRQRNDLFRHWVFGFGSGDLIVRPVGTTFPLELPNVLGVNRVVREIEQMIKEKVVIASPDRT